MHAYNRRVTSCGLWLDMLVMVEMVRVTYMFMMVLSYFYVRLVIAGYIFIVIGSV